MSFNNRNNLPNPSAPWGREVEQRIEGAERNISQTSLESSNGLSSTSNTLATLSNTINALLEQQSTLDETVQSLQTQQRELVELASTRTTAKLKKASWGPSMFLGAPPFAGNLVTIPFPEWASLAIVEGTFRAGHNLTEPTNSAISGVVFGSDASGVETSRNGKEIAPTTAFTGNTPSGLSNGFYNAQATASTIIEKTALVTAVSGSMVWNNIPAVGASSTSLLVTFMSQ